MKRLWIPAFVCLALLGCAAPERPDRNPPVALSRAMGGDAPAGFARATEIRQFEFPRDHGPHPEFRTEWWYLTGNLSASGNRDFGYQLTFFRYALQPGPVDRKSSWGTGAIFMAHAALTDVSGNEHVWEERFSRGAAGLAGARKSPLRVWVDDWQMMQTGTRVSYDVPVLRLSARTREMGLDLLVEATKPVVLQGEEGLSRKGPEPGNASYYYSSTRMNTTGSVTFKGTRHEVRGLSWMDREWSTSALAPGQIGWDWFALHLSDSSEIMYYQMRTAEGGADPYSKGTIVAPDGTPRSLSREDVELVATRTWQGPRGRTYPSGWVLEIASEGIHLVLTPAVRDQLLEASVEYWEGAVTIQGSTAAGEVTGRGYVELTGYQENR